MTPSIAYRIDSLIQALDDIVLPAIDTDKSLAREQGQLVVAHLHLMKQQLAQADAFDRSELEAAAKLGQQLLAQTAEDAGLADARRTLQAALNEALPNVLEKALQKADRPAQLQDTIRALNGAIEHFVRTLRLHASRGSIDATTSTVLAHARQQSRRNRIWFASNGFDSERDSLPGYDSLFATRP
jgi:hypothetical protein